MKTIAEMTPSEQAAMTRKHTLEAIAILGERAKYEIVRAHEDITNYKPHSAAERLLELAKSIEAEARMIDNSVNRLGPGSRPISD